jgi:hypothetical protein
VIRAPAASDEEIAALRTGTCRPPQVDLVVAADPAFDHLAALADVLLTHGHIHPYGEPVPDRMPGRTRIVDVVDRRVLEL